MKKAAELIRSDSCLNRARDDEMVFVILERDAAAPHAIREWAKKRIELGKNTADDLQVAEALACADYIEAHQSRDPDDANHCWCGVELAIHLDSLLGHAFNEPLHVDREMTAKYGDEVLSNRQENR